MGRPYHPLAAISGYDQAAGYAILWDDAFRRIYRGGNETSAEEVEYGFSGNQRTPMSPHEKLSMANGARVKRERSERATPAAAAVAEGLRKMVYDSRGGRRSD